MTAVVTEWAYRLTGFGESDITVPIHADPQCWQRHPFGWACTRRAGHGARHAAALSSGDVVAVWT